MIFLLYLALAWIIFATITDLRKREVPDWISFSLIAFALAYRAFLSVSLLDPSYLVNGVIGLGLFIVLGYSFYYARVFAGGDAKLMMALGAVLPLNFEFIDNLELFFLFIVLLLFSGAVYGLFYSLGLFFLDSRKAGKEMIKQMRARKKLFLIHLFFALVLLGFPIYLQEDVLFMLPLVAFLFPFLFSFAKAVEKVCLIKELDVKELAEGDWLAKPVKIGKKMLQPSWDGLSKEDIALLRKGKGKVLIKQGIPFVPAFLIAFILFMTLWDSSWSFFKIGF